MKPSYVAELLGRNFIGALDLTESELDDNGRNVDPSDAEKGKGYIIVLTVAIPHMISAILKTIFDLFTRKFVPEETIKEKAQQLVGFDNDQVDALVKRCNNYNAKSNSSEKLQSQLCKNKYKHGNASEGVINHKVNEYLKSINEQHKEDYIKNGVTGVLSITLEKRDEIANREDTQEELTQLNTHYKNRMKMDITAYLLAPHNNGKKMQHIILQGIEETRKTPQECFIFRAEKQVQRLNENEKSSLSFGNVKKIAEINTALNNYQKEPHEANKVAVNQALAIKRYGVFSCITTQSEKEVGEELMSKQAGL